jgi:hypothetical protein
VGDLVLAVVQRTGELLEDLGPARCAQRHPLTVVEGGPGCGHRGVDVSEGALGHDTDDLLGRR